MHLPQSYVDSQPLVGFTLAADIGQSHDYSAFVILESHLPARHPTGSRRQWRHDVRHVERVRDLPYPRVIDRIRNLRERLDAERGQRLRSIPTRVVIDATGVGKPILDALQDARVPDVTGVIITAGDSVTPGVGVTRVPKRVLVTGLQLALQQDRLRVADALPFASVLRHELRGFRVAQTSTGHERFGNDVASWREAEHDDLVLAVALGVWRAEAGRPLTSSERRAIALW